MKDQFRRVRLVIDTESDGLKYEARNLWCIVCYDLDSGVWHVGTDRRDFEYLAGLIGHADKVIGHNWMQHDGPILNKFLGLRVDVGKVLDTMILSSLNNPDIPGGHSLGAWGNRLGEYKQDFTEFDKFSWEMVDYCAQDVRVTAELFKRLSNEMGLD